jgi:hypothetical protein
MLSDLLRDGRIGFEMAMDIKAPTVTGVFGVYQRGDRFDRPPRIDSDEDDLLPG